MPKKPIELKHIPTPPLYQKVAGFFVGVAAVLIIVISFVAFGRATIVVHPRVMRSVESVVADISTDGTPGKLKGVIADLSGSSTATVSLKGEAPKPGKAHGTMTITNDYSRAQVLVATTRFLSSDGVLVRSTSTIHVDPKEHVTVQVVADESGSKGEGTPTRWTIPGLSKDLQKYIYGTTDKALEGGMVATTHIVASDIDQAFSQAEKRATDQAVASFVVAPTTWNATRLASSDRKTDAVAGKEASEVTATVSIKLRSITIDRSAIEPFLREHLAAKLSAQSNRLTINMNDLKGELGSIASDGKSAQVTFTIPVEFTAASSQVTIAKNHLVGQSVSTVREQLKQIPNIGDITVSVKPSWFWRMPLLKDRITITVEE